MTALAGVVHQVPELPRGTLDSTLVAYQLVPALAGPALSPVSSSAGETTLMAVHTPGLQVPILISAAGRTVGVQGPLASQTTLVAVLALLIILPELSALASGAVSRGWVARIHMSRC